MQRSEVQSTIPTLPGVVDDEQASPTLAGDVDHDEELVGTVLVDRYRIVEKLGEGGMAAVFLAEHVTIGKRCAVKILFPEHAHRTDLVDRFLQEARAASMIEHENVVEITDFGRAPHGSVFFVMELLTGEDLADTLVHEHRIAWPRVQVIGLQIAAALAAAHDCGVIHRDLKPENCFRIQRAGNDDFIKVLDFGIAKIVSEVDKSGRGLTQTGSVFGSPEYLSPEQAAGERVDHRADIYSLGVILYELLTGRPPFYAESYMGFLTKHIYEEPLRPRDVAPDAEIPVELEAVVLKAMQKDRELRFQDMRELSAALEAVGTGAPPVRIASVGGRSSRSMRAVGLDGDFATLRSQRRRRAAIAGVLGIAVTALLAVYVSSRGDAGEKPAPVEPAVVVAPEPEPPPAEAAPEPAHVTVHVETNVEAEILDARDRRRLGFSNSEEGLALPRSSEPRALILVAEDHEELEIEVVSDDDQTVRHTLEKKRSERGRKRKTSKKRGGKRSAYDLRDPYAGK
ncbi:MAG: serine/threonine-protein kinase [Nannocystaceae bacterium]|nr:serine/threonine protein kinase [Myxococcales bacterium]